MSRVRNEQRRRANLDPRYAEEIRQKSTALSKEFHNRFLANSVSKEEVEDEIARLRELTLRENDADRKIIISGDIDMLTIRHQSLVLLLRK